MHVQNVRNIHSKVNWISLYREKKTFACLFPNQSAWCQSPDSPTHPHFSLVRPLTLGNDGSSLCRQSRCQSSRPDPVPGEFRSWHSMGCRWNSGDTVEFLTRTVEYLKCIYLTTWMYLHTLLQCSPNCFNWTLLPVKKHRTHIPSIFIFIYL